MNPAAAARAAQRPPTRLGAVHPEHEVRARAARALTLWTGDLAAVGQLVSRELLATIEFGYLGRDKLTDGLLAAVDAEIARRADPETVAAAVSERPHATNTPTPVGAGYPGRSCASQGRSWWRR